MEQRKLSKTASILDKLALILQIIAERREQGSVDVSDEEKRRIEKITGVPWEKMWIGQPAVIENQLP